MDELAASRRRVCMVVLLGSSLVVLLAVGLTTATMPHAEHVRTAALGAPIAPHRVAATTPTTVAPPTTAPPTTTSAPTPSHEALTAASVTTPRSVAPTTTTEPRRPLAVTPTTERPVAPTTAPPAPTVAAPPSAAAVLACIRQRESGGNYAAVSANGLYRGAYQFTQGTWDSAARLAGRPDLVGVPPNLVAPANQDAVALAEYEAYGLAPWGGHCP